MKFQKQVFRTLFFLFLLICLLSGLVGVVNIPVKAAPLQAPLPPTPGDIVISEFRTRGPGGLSDEFVEIFNPKSFAIDVSGLLIRTASSGGGAGSTRYTFPAGVILQPGQYYIVTSTGYSGSVAEVPPANLSAAGIADDSGIALTLSNGTTIIDAVGMSTGTIYKETTFLNPLTTDVNQSFERKDNGCTDSNDNSADFIWNQTLSNPQNSSAIPVQCLKVINVTSTVVDSPPSYIPGNVIPIQVTFSNNVNVTGSPQLILETGTVDTPAVYSTGSGTNTLTFNYTIQANDVSGDLDYVVTDSLSLNGGTITGAVGNAILTLPNPGTAGSLGANKNIIIDNQIPPSLISFTRQNPTTNPTNADSLTFRATFSEAVTNVVPTNFGIITTPVMSPAIPITITPISSSVYDLIITGGNLATYNGDIGLYLGVSPQIITDAVGMPLTNYITSPPTQPSNDETYTVDNAPPTVTINQAGSQVDPANATPINFAVVFSEPINASSFIPADITQTGTATGITWNITDSGDHITFTLSAIAVTGNGTLIPSIAANRVQDLALNNNTIASTSTDNSVTLTDNIPPTVTVNQEVGQPDPTFIFPIKFAVVFSEPIVTSIFTSADITQNGTATGITWNITNSGDNKTFTLSATAVTGFGTLIPSIAANRVTDLVGNNNSASTSTDNTVTYTPVPTQTSTPTRTATPTRTPTKTRTPTPVRTATKTRTPLPPPPPPPLVGINEFVPRPGHDWNNDGVINTGDEYIELINHGVVDANLSGYSLDDEANVGSTPYRIPAVTLKPGQRMVFYGSQTGIHLDDGGDAVRLNKPNGQLADAYNYTVAKYPDQSYCRLPDDGGLDDWNTDCYPTPGLKNALNGNTGNVPLIGSSDKLKLACPIGDNLPLAFALAECPSFGNIWSRFYWDKNGWFGEKIIPDINSKWDTYVD